MASVLNRGRRDRPLWYAKIKDHAGVWRMVATKQRTKAQAVRWAAEKEAPMANGAVGLSASKEKMFGEAPPGAAPRPKPPMLYRLPWAVRSVRQGPQGPGDSRREVDGRPAIRQKTCSFFLSPGGPG